MARNQLIKFIIILTLFIPLVVSGNISPFNFGKITLFRMGVEILVIVYLISIIKKSVSIPKPNILSWALAFFLGSFFISSVLGINYSKSFWGDSLRGGGFINLLHFFLFFVIASTVPRSYFFNFFKISIFVAFIISFGALSQKVGFLPSFLKSGPAISTIGNAALLSGYLLFNIFFALYFFVNTANQQRWGRFYYLSFIFIGSAVIYLANVRGAILGLLLGLIYFVSNLWVNKKYNRTLRYAEVGIIIFILLFTANYFGGYFELPFLSKLIDRFTNITTIDSRFDSWRIALVGWTERPLIGWGPENFSAIYSSHFNPRFFIDSTSENSWDRSHNLLLEILSAQGIVGVISFIFLIAAAFILIKRISIKTERLMVTAAIIAYIIHTSFIFDSVSSSLIIFLTFAFLNSYNTPENKNKNTKITLKTRCPMMVLIILSTFSLYFLNIKPIIADQHFERGKSLYLKTPENSISEFAKAINQNTPDKFHIRREFAILVLTKADLSDKSGVLPSENEFKFAIEQLENNLKEEKLNVFDHLYLSSLYINYGKQYKDTSLYDKAEELLLKAQKLFPTRQQVYYLLAETQLEKEKKNRAIANLNKAIDLNPDSPESYWRLALALKNIGKQKEAFEMAQKADLMKYGGTRGYLPDIFKLIDIHTEAGQYGQLISLHHRVMKMRPNYVQSYASVAAAYKEIGDKYSAVKYAEKALELSPSSVDQIRNFIESMNFIGGYNFSDRNWGRPVAIYNKPSDAELANWVNYSDKHYKFSISTPLGWNFYGSGGTGLRLKNDLFFNNLVHAKGRGFNGEGDMFTNTIITTNVQDDLKDWFMKNAVYPSSARNETFYYQEVVVDGLPGIVQYIKYKIPMYRGISPKTIKEYYFKKGDNIFQLKAYTVTGKDSEELILTFDKIISTLLTSD